MTVKKKTFILTNFIHYTYTVIFAVIFTKLP